MHKFYRNFIKSILIVCLLLAMTGCENQGDTFVRLDTGTSETEESSGSENTATSNTDISLESSVEENVYVFICGQVQNPGVYCMSPESRICDVIKEAGGCLETADICAVNQAERLTDGSKIYIPAIGETLPSSEMTEASDGLIHLNRATKEELMTLPGIGESKAELIIEYRETHGGFSTIDDIMNISGIKEGLFNNIKDYITVE